MVSRIDTDPKRPTNRANTQKDTQNERKHQAVAYLQTKKEEKAQDKKQEPETRRRGLAEGNSADGPL